MVSKCEECRWKCDAIDGKECRANNWRYYQPRDPVVSEELRHVCAVLADLCGDVTEAEIDTKCMHLARAQLAANPPQESEMEKQVAKAREGAARLAEIDNQTAADARVGRLVREVLKAHTYWAIWFSRHRSLWAVGEDGGAVYWGNTLLEALEKAKAALEAAGGQG